MDFRAISPSELTWLPARGMGKTKTAVATLHGKKITIQTPTCPTRMFTDAGSRTLYLKLDDSEVHRHFATWIEALEAAAPDMNDYEKSPSLRNGSLRLMVWDDAQWFDASGAFLKDPPKAVGKCTCVLEFGGCWISTGARWGLKFRVSQIQVAAEDPDPPAKAKSYSFIDD